jgi:hypothetical protein
MGDGKILDLSQQFHGDVKAWQIEEFHTMPPEGPPSPFDQLTNQQSPTPTPRHYF